LRDEILTFWEGFDHKLDERHIENRMKRARLLVPEGLGTLAPMLHFDMRCNRPEV
jgi:hypothetical protein